MTLGDARLAQESTTDPKGPSTQYLGTWDLGNSKYCTGFGEVYDY